MAELDGKNKPSKIGKPLQIEGSGISRNQLRDRLENKEFAEYYLVGTLASTLLAVGAGLLLKAVVAPF